MVKEILLACVGKPSAGKSSFLNAVSDATAKVGNYVPVDCPCKKYGKESQCRPRYGRCVEGTRFVPIQMMDVAGLVPGASQGLGLGNQFLDDLRHAHALIHVVDVSGTTDQNGKETQGYDPINDINWLRLEIHSWITNNLLKRWSSIVRRHVAIKNSTVDTLQIQLSGYGSTASVVAKAMDKSGIKEPLEAWDEDTVKKVVDFFMDVRFPTVVALNKIDMADADKNITKIMRRYDQNKLVLTSALAENFLRKIRKQNYIKYIDATDIVETKEDLPDSDLKPMDGKLKKKNLVLFRYGSTGVQEVLGKAVELLGVSPVYPVKSVSTFGSTNSQKPGAFRDCILVWPGTTVREFAKILHPEIDKYYLYAETVGNMRLSEDAVISSTNNIICYKTAMAISGKTSLSSDAKTDTPDKKAKK
ncbi:45.2 kDa GTP-binding protein [Zychaea mexicana]|uniref:45.2 kDa GTP-binding protein n=1 Tax=Zychaea mexicana TaxID=64656 RepID=UPI0022FDC128|nr:45.2 kDa GTP-binding protein [Zychaea mexicana]KAI9484696.1 45.2 kDa GTP-binding protein [Zychaea mexicana]